MRRVRRRPLAGRRERAVERGQRVVVARVGLVALLVEAPQRLFERFHQCLATVITGGRARTTRTGPPRTTRCMVDQAPRAVRRARRSCRRSGCWPRRGSGAGCGRRRYASRPASTASFIAVAIATGSRGQRDRRVHQHAVGAELHRDRRVRRRADAGVDDHRHARLLVDDPDVVRILDAETRSDRRAERHDRRRARFLELPADDRIVVRVGQHDEAFAHEHARRLEQRDVVGEERALVADDLELHPVREPDLARQPRRADRVVRRVAARRCSAG